ncbi:3D (Asp-Asp-Asp) domain-containing protein [Granulicatella balaenopterae]|uniref:3D (Asp-Asp-Asp) domain-containing protein n=1 Tax=Granulicatella balaenopterae TaxID=137733 RepID=A0A1H9PA65_9LACT|nr:3D domain-containing protein [Granulicatella balaenopterae]SER45001.1 3D (Asp-Asp-Asp) domain-containing protein [Granulicatella balaenopterae]
MKIKNMFLVFVATLSFVGYTVEQNIEVIAKEWNARTVEDVQKEVEVDDNGEMHYTVQWGDTLSIVSLASGMPLQALQQLNNIEQANMIYAGMDLTLIGNQTIVAIDPNKPAAEEVEEPVAEEEVEEPVAEEEVEEPVAEEVVEEVAPQPVQQSGYELTVEASAYSYQEAGLSSYTADGTNLANEPNIIAVDPSVIPLGTLVEIPGYGVYRAADTGGAIKGNRIDIHMTSIQAMNQFGRRTITIKVLN